MKLGVSFPTAEIGTDRGAIRSFLQTVDELGFDHLTNIDHVLGVDEAGIGLPAGDGPLEHALAVDHEVDLLEHLADPPVTDRGEVYVRHVRASQFPARSAATRSRSIVPRRVMVGCTIVT